jgi:hypothetical protein
LLKRHADPDSRFDLGDLADAVSTGSFLLDLVISILLPVVLVLAILFSELLLMLLLLPAALFLRMLFKLPWVVEVRRNGKLHHVEFVRGWTAAGERVSAIADRIRAVGGRGNISKSRYDPGGADRGDVHRL